MIAVTRDGEIIRADALSQEQKETALAAIFRSFLAQHPEVVQTGGQDAVSFGTGDT